MQSRVPVRSPAFPGVQAPKRPMDQPRSCLFDYLPSLTCPWSPKSWGNVILQFDCRPHIETTREIFEWQTQITSGANIVLRAPPTILQWFTVFELSVSSPSKTSNRKSDGVERKPKNGWPQAIRSPYASRRQNPAIFLSNRQVGCFPKGYGPKFVEAITTLQNVRGLRSYELSVTCHVSREPFPRLQCLEWEFLRHPYRQFLIMTSVQSNNSSTNNALPSGAEQSATERFAVFLRG